MGAVVALVLVLVAAACADTSSTGSSPSPALASSTPAAPEGLEAYYGQELFWQPCEGEEGDFECARLTVPLDYDDPEGQTIEIALKKRLADGTSIGDLVINPGGPGGSGIELVGSLEDFFSDALLESYDVVGFDPRGVGESTAVECLTDAELDEDRSASDSLPQDATESEIQADVTQTAQSYSAKCAANTTTPGLLENIDTVSAARDLDVLRAALGQDVLTYLGYSYGTYLGATYADLFPTNVGRMVLDGGVDPSLSAAEITLGQAEGFEMALRAFIEDCQSGDACPLTGDVDSGVGQVRTFLEATRTTPVPTSDPARPLTASLAEDAIVGIMYQSESWGVLAEALDQAMLQNDGSTLLAIADIFASRNDDGTYTGNGDEVIAAINCLDYPVEGDTELWAMEADEIEAASPTFGRSLAYSDLYCQAWGARSTRERKELHAAGAAPILVVGTTRDPATPYDWSVSLADQLDSGRLLTWDGDGHTAYGRAGQCVTEAVDSYLLSGVMPEEGLTCGATE